MVAVTNNYSSPIAMPTGEHIGVGETVEVGEVDGDHYVIQQWLDADPPVITVSGTNADKANAKQIAADAKAKADADAADAADAAKTKAQVDAGIAAAANTPGQPQTLEDAGTKQQTIKK